jgi:hypothetical protein
MADCETEQARNALAAIPEFAGRDPKQVAIERLGGLTNLVSEALALPVFGSVQHE